MLHLLRGLYDEWTRTEPYCVLVLGSAGAGKSGLLAALTRAAAGRPGLPIRSLRPTLGQSVVEIPLPLPLPPPLAQQVAAAQAAASAAQPWFAPAPRPARGHLKFWDVGASADLPTLWPRYYPDAECVVYVVDASVFAPLAPPADGEPARPLGPDAEHAWHQLAAILSHPSLRAKPVLVAISKVDTLPLHHPSAPPHDVRHGTQLAPTAPGSPLDRFEESVRTWFAHRFAHDHTPDQAEQQAAAPAEDQTLDHGHPAGTPPAPADTSSSVPSDLVPAAADPLDDPPSGPDAGTEEEGARTKGHKDRSATGREDCASDPAPPAAGPPAQQPGTVQSAHPRPSSRPQDPPGDPTGGPGDSKDARDKCAISERYWEVVCVSAVSLVGLADLACCLQLLAQQAE